MEKEKVTALAFVALVLFLAILSCNQSTQLRKGDVDMNGRVDQADVDLLVKIAVGEITPTKDQMWAGDMNNDGRINSADAGILQRMIDNDTNNTSSESTGP